MRAAHIEQRRRVPAAAIKYPYALTAAAIVAGLAISALVNRRLTKAAERDNPPAGRFLEVDGVRLHYVERGSGAPLVLLHGNGSMIQDFETSGLVDLAARDHRVIAFDRPGFGHSDRPWNVVWTPVAQAELLHVALKRLGVEQALVFGHSWGASVAVAFALRYPQMVRGLVLASGYYYPSFRLDVLPMSAPAAPLAGDILRYTVAPIAGRLIWPRLMARIFGPRGVPREFKAGFPKEMALRPSQIRASAEESALMVPDAFRFKDEYAKLKMPVVIVAGNDDRVADTDSQSARLHVDVPQSKLRRIPGHGHMVHQTATRDVMAAIDEAAEQAEVIEDRQSPGRHGSHAFEAGSPTADDRVHAGTEETV